ncbi:proheparin-binding EGF-like growth factor [Brienomyrus brachyistius]|uniref:proheparin-binding EGF-like growth factor n=1 Tax=Brienomyrus brachyistius TaxID=42636 RepID=UPI0020B243C7|nr:proheparin-binding EGF-like growth factor [Brienomyrus brachyistius]XP_048860198.1 proheparin-binding EGF-like growth factor [Brienomyrus brachyistius]
MNVLVLYSLLLTVCSIVRTLGLDPSKADVAPHTTTPNRIKLTTTSAAIDPQKEEDAELDHDQEEGSLTDADLPQVQLLSKPEDKGKNRKKGKGKRKSKNRGSPESTQKTPSYTQYPTGHTDMEDPCSTTHQDYCIHGHCKYMEDLKASTCICIPGYDGERCGIRLLKTEQKESDMGQNAAVIQTVLVVIAVVLSLISCTTIVLMMCAHYRTQKNILAAYLGTGSEKEKLQTNANSIVV